MAIRRVLHLVGSPTNDFFRDLSEVYARSCIAALEDPALYTFVIALVTPDGMWRFPRSLDRDVVVATEPVDFARAMALLASARIDVALPQMFCHAGMTDYRALLDVLRIPYLGNRPLQMAMTANKAMARAIVAGAGVAVPEGEVLRRGDVPTLGPPVVVKPATSDNSEGVSLVRSSAEYAGALELAFSFASTVVVERYIELGREVRCGIVVRDGSLLCLPLEEYYVDAVARPIRRPEDKLKRGADAGLTLAAKEATQSWIVGSDEPIVSAVHAAARRCHVALGCEQYGLFDFRIDPQGRPWFLEAGLYCSFSPMSVISTMMAAAGVPLEAFFASAIDQVIGPRRA